MATKQKMTLEKLARLVTEGFDGTASKEELTATKEELGELRTHVDEEFGSVRSELSMLRDEVTSQLKQITLVLGPLVRGVAGMEIDLRELRSRVNRLERKVGIVR
jgi:hypothetical protein